MNLEMILQIAILIGVVAFALLAIEVRNLTHSIILLAIMSVLLGMAFWLLFAPYPAVFQLSVYAGAVTVLLLAALSLTSRKEEEV